MEAKSRAAFINSVTGGQNAICPTCGVKVSVGSKFCYICGTKMTPELAPEAIAAPESVLVSASEPSPSPTTSNVAFAPAQEAAVTTVAEQKKPHVQQPARVAEQPERMQNYEEVSSEFAKGLPEWSIEPPQVVVRRRVHK